LQRRRCWEKLVVMRLAIAFVLLGATSGCGRAAAEPALYTGRVSPQVRSAAQVTIEPAVPETSLLVGDVVARCRADDGVVAFERESLADVDCSDELLVASLRERAAAAGGAALVGLRCTATKESRDGALDSELRSCSAMVAAPRGKGEAPSDHGESSGFVPPYDNLDEAFAVRVTLVPAEKEPVRRHAVPSDSVHELAYVPPGRVVVGDIVAKGDTECGHAAVRHAVRAAAGRVGATDVVGIACVHREHGFICTGRAARPEVDEL
jgi:hypothetical protein